MTLKSPGAGDGAAPSPLWTAAKLNSALPVLGQRFALLIASIEPGVLNCGAATSGARFSRNPFEKRDWVRRRQPGSHVSDNEAGEGFRGAPARGKEAATSRTVDSVTAGPSATRKRARELVAAADRRAVPRLAGHCDGDLYIRSDRHLWKLRASNP